MKEIYLPLTTYKSQYLHLQNRIREVSSYKLQYLHLQNRMREVSSHV